MSVQYGKVVSLILLERFGAVVEKVGSFLFQSGPNPLLYIKNNVNLPLSKVKEALCILIKYRLVEFAPNRNENIANYTLQKEMVFLMLRFPKYINHIKKQFGDESEMIIEEILLKSYLSASQLIVQVVNKFKTDHNKAITMYKVKEHLISLINAKYLMRLPSTSENSSNVPNLMLNEEEMFELPKIDLHSLEIGSKKENNCDSEIYWTTNFDRFHQDFRDKLIVNCFSRKFDDNAGEFIRLLLQQMYIRTQPWAESSNSIPTSEIRDFVRKQNSHPHLLAFFDQYMSVIEQDNSKLIRKAGDAGGGSLQICLKNIFHEFAWEVIEQMVLERFDGKAARIFRLVKSKQYIEPDQIQQLAMIPAKEAKRLCYKLLEENFFQIQELKRANSNGPNKSFNLFYVNLTHTVRVVLELCYKTLFNVMTKKNLEKFNHRRVIDKKQRVDTIIMGMKAQGATEEQLSDIEEMVTPPESEILSKIERHMKKLNTAELEVDDTVFLLQTYLFYQYS